MTQTILMIEDDEQLASLVAEYLGDASIDVCVQNTASDGLRATERTHYDAVVLDVMLPDVDGFEVCRRIRAASDVPILMLTARGDEMDRIIGLELGADDYLPKPFNPRELLARLKAILRRTGHSVKQPELLRFGAVELDLARRQVRLRGVVCPLTSHQFEILRVLATHAGRVMSRDAIMDQVRGDTLEVFDRSIDVHISRIRAAIETDPRHPERIITVRGIGYVFAREQDV